MLWSNGNQKRSFVAVLNIDCLHGIRWNYYCRNRITVYHALSNDRIKSAVSMLYLRAGLRYCTSHTALFLLSSSFYIHSTLHIDQPLSSNMLLPYALLFFLFTTFVAAVPTMMLQKRFSFDFIMNKEFLAANDGAWTRVESVSRLYLIFWIFFTYMTKAAEKVGRKHVFSAEKVASSRDSVDHRRVPSRQTR